MRRHSTLSFCSTSASLSLRSSKMSLFIERREVRRDLLAQVPNVEKVPQRFLKSTMTTNNEDKLKSGLKEFSEVVAADQGDRDVIAADQSDRNRDFLAPSPRPSLSQTPALRRRQKHILHEITRCPTGRTLPFSGIQAYRGPHELSPVSTSSGDNELPFYSGPTPAMYPISTAALFNKTICK